MKRLIAIVLFCVLVPCVYGETITYDEGKYIGDVSNGVPYGHGTYYHTGGIFKGDKYVGSFRSGNFHGYGAYIYGGEDKGSKVVGEFRDNEPVTGTYTIETGDFKGDKYVGEFKGWEYHGQGTYTFADGDTLVGQFRNNQPFKGTHTFGSGEYQRDKYVGEFKGWSHHGRGTYTFATSGDKYVGEFKNDKFDGQGIFTYGSGEWEGDTYVGQFKDNQKSGQGTFTRKDGSKYAGEWKDDKAWEGVYYYASGAVWGTYTGGEWCGGCKPTAKQLAVTTDLSTLTVRSNPSHADTYIDNSYKGETELEIELPPGYYSVRVEKSGYEGFQQRIHLKQNMDLWASLTKKDGAEPSLGSLELIGTGTGFVVNKDYVVTADHVLEDCTAISIRHSHKEIDAETVARDAANDLGLIRLSQQIWNTAKLRGGRPARKGESVSNYGYPLFGELGNSATITEGNINNLSGLGNDSRFIQFDAPSQPGNSGGPVLDSSGNVVGVASHILSKKYADASGHIAQNVNFAVKSYIVEGFLSSNNVSFEKAESKQKLELPDIAEKAERFTVLVGCWQ